MVQGDEMIPVKYSGDALWGQIEQAVEIVVRIRGI